MGLLHKIGQPGGAHCNARHRQALASMRELRFAVERPGRCGGDKGGGLHLGWPCRAVEDKVELGVVVFTGEAGADFLDQRECMAANPRIYAQLVQTLGGFSKYKAA